MGGIQCQTAVELAKKGQHYVEQRHVTENSRTSE